MLPFTKRNARLEEQDSDLVGTGEIEVVETRETSSRSRSIRPAQAASIRPVALAGQQRQAPVFELEQEPAEEQTRAMERGHKSYPPITPAAGAPPQGRAARLSAPPSYGEDDECTIARPVSSAPPAISGNRSTNRPPSLSIRTPAPSPSMPAMLEEQERTAMMQVPAGVRARAITLETPATVMAPAGAIPAELRAQVLAQMQASRSGTAAGMNGAAHGGSAMDQAIAAQLANVQRAQPISPPAHLMMPQSTNSAMTLDPPATVLTARVKPPIPRSTLTWAAALLSMGVFVGLVTAAVVRKDNEAEAAAQAARNQQVAAASQMANATTMGSMNAQNAGPSGQSGQSFGSQAQQQQIQQPYGQNGQAVPQNPNAMGAASNPNAVAMNGAMNGAAPSLGAIAGNGLPAAANMNSMPVNSITPEQLAAMTSGQAVANPNTVANAVVTPADPAAVAPTRHSSSASTHSHTARAVPQDSTAAAPVAATPRPTPTPSRGRKSSGPSDDDVNSAAKALAKAQLEQSL